MAGRDKSEALEHTQSQQSQEVLKASSGSIVQDVIHDAIASPIEAVQGRAQEIVNTSSIAANDPIKELINDAIANPIAVITNPVGEVENVVKKSLLRNLFK